MRIFIWIIVSYIIYACTSSQSNTEEPIKHQYTQQRNTIDIQILQDTVFQKQLFSNGKLKALRKTDLTFSISDKIQRLLVKNGSQVKEGQYIAILEQFEYQQQLCQAQTALHKAKLEFQDMLIGQGYDLADSANIPQNLFETASIRSGYKEAKNKLEQAKYDLEATVLKAPFPGVVANLEQKQYEQANTGKVFCTIINDSRFEVEFQLVESEISDVELQDKVSVIPFSMEETFKGKISEINPVVDENGLITVKAVVNNPGPLMEGMNVKVLIKKAIPDQLVVPKSAVVLRQNQEVLFKYVNGKAFWTYVQTGLENSTSYTVQAHPDKGGTLAAGDTVIVSGNLNLAHESDVVVE